MFIPIELIHENFSRHTHLGFTAHLHGKPSPVVTVPVQVVSDTPFIQLSFNGIPHQFMLDTGSMQALHISEAFAKRIAELSYTGKTQKSVNVKGELNETPLFDIKTLDVNGLEFHQVLGVIYKPWGVNWASSAASATPSSEDEESVLGIGFFKDKQLLIDIPNRILQFASAQDRQIIDSADGWKCVPFEIAEEGIVLIVKNGKHRYRMVLDTGVSPTSAVKSLVASQSAKLTPCKLDLGEGKPCQSLQIDLPAKRSVSAISVDITERFKADGLLGMDFFNQYAVYLNWPKKTLMIKASR